MLLLGVVRLLVRVGALCALKLVELKLISQKKNLFTQEMTLEITTLSADHTADVMRSRKLLQPSHKLSHIYMK